MFSNQPNHLNIREYYDSKKHMSKLLGPLIGQFLKTIFDVCSFLSLFNAYLHILNFCLNFQGTNSKNFLPALESSYPIDHQIQ